MSANFTGVTFAQQKVSPSDDAIIRRTMLQDGILTGCAMSYSGSTLTMAAGQLLICGRQVRHPSSQNWPVVNATSGFARLVLTIDLTRTSTKDAFDQVVDSIEYASSQDGFVDLIQSDINGSGMQYQVAACVVSLGAGGITGIVSQMEACASGGGGGLNFKLVGGVTQPSGPSENMIWVNTSETVTDYVFSPTEPEEASEGMVWIVTDTASDVAFNALKKNAIILCPKTAKQYVGGAWVDVTAKSYMDGAWVNWPVYLYDGGDQCTVLTGGWKSSRANGLTIAFNGENVTMKVSGATFRVGTIYTAEKIDVSRYSRLKIQVSDLTLGFDTAALAFGVISAAYTANDSAMAFVEAAAASSRTTEESVDKKILEVDLSGINSGSYVVQIISGGVNVTVHKCWLE